MASYYRPDWVSGTITLTAGEIAFAISGADLNVIGTQPGDEIYHTTTGRWLIIADVGTDGVSGNLAYACPADLAGDDLPLRIRFQPDGSRFSAAYVNVLQQLSQGIVINVDARGSLAKRADYDGRESGFVYLRTDVDPWLFYVKNSATSGDWSVGTTWVGPPGDKGDTGDRGPQGPVTVSVGTTTTGAGGSNASVANSGTADDVVLDFTIPQGLDITWKGAWLTATAYAVNDAVSQNGSSYICATAHTSGTFADDLTTGKWSLMAQKGSGDVQAFADAASAEAATIETGTQTIVVAGQNYVPVTADYSGLGPELISNGGFDSDTEWTKGEGWSIADGVASHAASSTDTFLISSEKAVDGKAYLVSFDVVSITSGALSFSIGAGAQYQKSAPGNYSFVEVASGTSAFGWAPASSVGSIDNLSVKALPDTAIQTADGQWWAAASANADDITKIGWVDRVGPLANDDTKVPAGNVVTSAIQSSLLVPPDAINVTDYTIQLADTLSKLKTTTSSDPVTITIPANSAVPFPPGSVLSLLQGGAGNVTVVGSVGVSLNSLYGPVTSVETYQQNSMLYLIKTGTDAWLVVVVSSPGFRLGTTETFDTAGSGTWNRPSWARAAIVEGRGAGGAGGTPSTSGAAGGGAQGGYSRKFITNLADSYPYTVGAGGVPVAFDGAVHTGGNGGNTTWGTDFTAFGGSGGGLNAVAGGDAQGGDLNIPGAPGMPRVQATDAFAGAGGGEGGGLGGVASGSHNGNPGKKGGGGGGGRDGAGTGAEGALGGDGWITMDVLGA